MSNDLIVKHIPPPKWYKRSKWELMEDLDNNGHIIPKGFITDGATVPLLISIVFSPTGKYMRDAVLHDYLLDTIPDVADRSEVDGIFYDAMKAHKVPLWRRSIMFMSVRVFGWFKVTWARLRRYINEI